MKLVDGALTIYNLEAGFYNLYIGEETSINIVISNANPSQSKIKGLEQFILESDPMLETFDSVMHPLYIHSISQDDDSSVNVKIRNWTPSTRVCVVATRFLPHKAMFNSMSVTEMENPWSKYRSERTSAVYQTGRVLGEEYQYILNRKAQPKHWVGNMLTKPSILLTPVVSPSSVGSSMFLNTASY
jgi:hypothetical protein